MIDGNILLQQAYKKLKSWIYYDKGQAILRNRIVEFETNCENVDKWLEKIWEIITGSEGDYQLFERNILKSICVDVFPKSLKKVDSKIIKNYSAQKTLIEENQYFIDLNVEGHLLSVLWILLIGVFIDKREIYEHAYGNRLTKTLEEKTTFSPYLFEPYYFQYETWRDKALDLAKNHLNQNQDVMVLTMDFSRFFYSVNIKKEFLEDLLYKDSYTKDSYTKDSAEEVLKNRLNNFIFLVMEQYSKKLQYLDANIIKKKVVFPIGFLPSNILSNYFLAKFDKAISDGWNPTYYGRYVDDILIVDKIEKNSDIYEKFQREELNQDDIFQFFLSQCSRWLGLSLGEDTDGCHDSSCSNRSLLIPIANLEQTTKEKKNSRSTIKDDKEYRVNTAYLQNGAAESEVTVQNKKVGLFYFRAGESEALIDCFRKRIRENASEFRFMADDESSLLNDDYSEIYSLINNDNSDKENMNKIREVNGVQIDKYALSKHVGKAMKIGSKVKISSHSKFEKEIKKIFTPRIIIENYIVWERVFQIFVMSKNYTGLQEFVKKINEAILNTYYPAESDDGARQKELAFLSNRLRETLQKYLLSSFARSLSVNYSNDVDLMIDNVINFLGESSTQDFRSRFGNIRKGYLFTRMFNKYSVPLVLDLLLGDIKEYFNNPKKNKINKNLSSFNELLNVLSENETKEDYSYKYYPYYLSMREISLTEKIKCLYSKSDRKYKEDDNLNKQFLEKNMDIYNRVNYQIPRQSDINNKKQNDNHRDNLLNKSTLQSFFSTKLDALITKVGDKKADSLCIGIANVQLSVENMKGIFVDSPNRSLSRYKELKKIVNQAIEEKVNLLVLPENYVPYEWVEMLGKISSDHQIAIVAGVEHLKIKRHVFNLTAVVLPYETNSKRDACIAFHEKIYFSPLEREIITGYNFIPWEGKHYQLFCWNDCWFPVYCCYELASINDRARFQSYADMVVVVEWNSDINYFSNIIDSLSRDIHCYCVQANCSKFGDSRITQPSKTENKDIVRTKGGKNHTILVEEVSISKLRDFQIKKYPLSKIEGAPEIYKPTPPNFNREIVLKKIKHSLCTYLKLER